MTRYVALLRGVNVGGITLKMADLAEVFTTMGLGNVKTVLASGNVLFDSPQAASELKPALENALSERFGYEAWVHVVELDVIEGIILDFPFDADREGWQPYVVFVSVDSDASDLTEIEEALDPAAECIRQGKGVIYWTVQRGNSLSSDFARQVAKARHKSFTTTRNLRTLKKLLS
ncbi:MAG: hypothetical protein JWQ68_847 [Cryobacterium sp.]|jgi:uncharacterized protein (DUF1697 family)|nr:hypothetical protein [Cryobacterium sp.]